MALPGPSLAVVGNGRQVGHKAKKRLIFRPMPVQSGAGLDIIINSAPQALYDPGNAGFSIWYVPSRHSDGWGRIEIIPNAFSEPCECVDSAFGLVWTLVSVETRT